VARAQAGGPPPGGSALGRLSRFDGAAFHPVVEGGVDVPFVHVFVHGWQPGFRLQERLHAVTDVVPAVPAWDPRLVDAAGRTLISAYLPLLAALAGLGADHGVLWYSWLDEAATDADMLLAFRSRQATQVNGRRLAMALQQSFGRRDVRMHLIGHSHGSAVVTHAAVSLGRAPEQLTFLDAPESPIRRLSGAADLIDAVLPRMRPGRGPGRTFVDSYSTVFGRAYHRKPGLSAVVDVALAAPVTTSRDPVRAINSAHLYAVDWYARSVREAARGVGYGWSPLAGTDTTALHPSYQAFLRHRPMRLRRRRDLPLSAPARRVTARRARRTDLDGAVLALSVATPVAALVLHSTPGDYLVEFDLDVRGDGSELVEIDLDGVPAFVAQARLPVPSSGRYVLLADGRPGDHLLTARLLLPERRHGRRAGDREHPDTPQPAAAVRGLRVVNRPGAVPGFSVGRTTGVAFAAGAAAGSVATAAVLVTTEWTVRRLLALLTRRRHGHPRAAR